VLVALRVTGKLPFLLRTGVFMSTNQATGLVDFLFEQIGRDSEHLARQIAERSIMSINCNTANKPHVAYSGFACIACGSTRTIADPEIEQKGVCKIQFIECENCGEGWEQVMTITPKMDNRVVAGAHYRAVNG